MKQRPKARAFSMYPLVGLAAAFAFGIALQNTINVSIATVAAALAVSASAALVFRRSYPGTALAAFSFVLLGSICQFVETNCVRNDRIKLLFDSGILVSGEPVEIEGRLAAPPEPAFQGEMITLDADTVTYHGETRVVSGKVRINAVGPNDESLAAEEDLDLRYGSRISVACVLTREEQYQNPGVQSRLAILDRQGIDATANLKSRLLIEKLGDDTVFLPLAWVYDLRQLLIEEIQMRFTHSTAGVLTASMLGDKYYLDKTTADVFREGGTFHVLVISGLHITFIGGLLLMAVRGLTRKRITQFLITTAALWSYTLAVGADVPVVRASVMFTVLMFSQVIHRQGSLLNSLGACVIVLLAWRPSDLFNPSFQLTVVSVIAIVAAAFPLIEKLRAIGSWMPSASSPFPPTVSRPLRSFCETLYWRPAAWRIESARQIWSARIFKTPYAKGGQTAIAYIFEGLLISAIVQAFLLPFLIIYFHRAAPVSIVMNLWIGVVMAAESFTALAAVVTSHFSEFLASPMFGITEFLNYLLVAIPDLFTSGRWASWRVPHYAGLMKVIYPLYCLSVAGLGIAVWKWKPFQISSGKQQSAPLHPQFDRGIAAAVCAALGLAHFAVIIFHPYSAPKVDGRLHIDFLDVGQGDSALVTYPDGTTMLVDGGGRLNFRNESKDGEETFVPDTPGIGESVVSPVLWEKGYSKIDYILATHADADHIQGLAEVADNFDIGNALFGRMPYGDPEFQALNDVLESRGVPIMNVSRGKLMHFGGATVEVLYPAAGASEKKIENNNSVVIRIVYGSRAFLLTGDVEAVAEQELLKNGGTLKADVVKVPHHGSRTSSTDEFVEAVKPQHAVISVGRRSWFGHPDASVSQRWRSAGASVWTTGESGMITFVTDGKDLTLSRYR